MTGLPGDSGLGRIARVLDIGTGWALLDLVRGTGPVEAGDMVHGHQHVYRIHTVLLAEAVGMASLGAMVLATVVG